MRLVGTKPRPDPCRCRLFERDDYADLEVGDPQTAQTVRFARSESVEVEIEVDVDVPTSSFDRATSPFTKPYETIELHKEPSAETTARVRKRSSLRYLLAAVATIVIGFGLGALGAVLALHLAR